MASFFFYIEMMAHNIYIAVLSVKLKACQKAANKYRITLIPPYTHFNTSLSFVNPPWECCWWQRLFKLVKSPVISTSKVQRQDFGQFTTAGAPDPDIVSVMHRAHGQQLFDSSYDQMW